MGDVYLARDVTSYGAMPIGAALQRLFQAVNQVANRSQITVPLSMSRNGCDAMKRTVPVKNTMFTLPFFQVSTARHTIAIRSGIPKNASGPAAAAVCGSRDRV
jgi:hypothetical protein